MTSAAFEPAVSTSGPSQDNALDRAATEVGAVINGRAKIP